MRIRSLVLLFLGALFVRSAIAAEPKFSVTTDREQVPLGEVVQLFLTFSDMKNVPAPNLPAINGFESRYLGPLTRVSVINGQSTSSISHRYLLVPQRAGRFQVGPFTVEFGGKTMSAPAVTIEVTASSAPAVNGTAASPSPASLGKKAFATLEISKPVVYLNEPFTITVKFFVQGMAVKDVHFPTLDTTGFTMQDFTQPQQYQSIVNGQTYDTLEFKTKIFPTRTGSFELGPAHIKSVWLIPHQAEALPGPAGADEFFSSFFGSFDSQPLDIPTPAVPIQILPWPDDGRPGDFSGAIGSFSLQTTAEPRNVRVGDPITLRSQIQGTGNAGTVKPPRLASEEGFKVYEPRSTENEGGVTIEQVLLPRSTDVKEVPALSLSFFDPDARQYKTLTSGPFPIVVTPAEDNLASKITESPSPAPAKRAESLGSDILFIKESPGPWHRRGDRALSRPVFWTPGIVAILGALAAYWRQRRREIFRADPKFARRYRAPRRARQNLETAKTLLNRGDAPGAAMKSFRTLEEYLADYFHATTGTLTIDDVRRHLETEGGTAELLEKITDVFTTCDALRYAPSAASLDASRRLLESTVWIIDHMERSHA